MPAPDFVNRPALRDWRRACGHGGARRLSVLPGRRRFAPARHARNGACPQIAEHAGRAVRSVLCIKPGRNFPGHATPSAGACGPPSRQKNVCDDIFGAGGRRFMFLVWRTCLFRAFAQARRLCLGDGKGERFALPALPVRESARRAHRAQRHRQREASIPLKFFQAAHGGSKNALASEKDLSTEARLDAMRACKNACGGNMRIIPEPPCFRRRSSRPRNLHSDARRRNCLQG